MRTAPTHPRRVWGHITVGAALSFAASPVLADTLDCLLEDGTRLGFTIDRNQFIDAVTPEEPIRRKVTTVRRNDTQFAAEPFLIGDMRGFHAEGLPDGDIMFVVQPDGSATLSNTRADQKIAGTCEVS